MITPEQIKKLRSDNAWSVADLAERCGVSPRTVENWMQGRTGISGPAQLILKSLMEKRNDEQTNTQSW